jgi:hypothetical protein
VIEFSVLSPLPFLFGHAVHAGLFTLDSYPICVVPVERGLDEIP